MDNVSKTIKQFDDRVETYDKYGKLHSFDDEPAVIYISGDKKGTEKWYKHGQKHRDGDRPAQILYEPIEHKHPKYKMCSLFWYQYDKLHREDDKPAVEWYDLGFDWYQNGKRHREEGPASISQLTSYQTEEKYYLNGQEVPKEYLETLKTIKNQFDKVDKCFRIELLKLVAKNVLN